MAKRLAQQSGGAILLQGGGALLLEQPAISVIISGSERNFNIEAYTLSIQNILTKKRDLATFNIITHAGDNYVPAMGREVIIYLDEVKIFGGIITEVESKPTAFGTVRHKIVCQDYTRLLDKKLVPDAFENQTVNEIIEFLKDNYFPSDFTINNVDADIVISAVSFAYKPLAKCIEQLAEMINYDWYVDYDKDLHFFAKEEEVAPFNLTDSNGKYEYDSLVIRRDNSQVRNTVIVRGGEYLAAQSTFDVLTNGTDRFYYSPYKLGDFEASLTGVQLNVGEDDKDDPDDYDALYNFNEKIIKFKEGDKPNANKTLKMAGKPSLPVIVKVTNPVEIAAMASAEGSDGIYEYLVNDPTITSKESARQRGRAELLAYAETLVEGEFVTTTPGLKAGQAITIQSDTRGLNETFIINRVVLEQFGVDSFKYHVSLVTTRTFDLIDVLQRLLIADVQRDLDIDPDDLIDTVTNLADTMATSDSVAATTTAGPYEYDAGATWGGAVWG